MRKKYVKATKKIPKQENINIRAILAPVYKLMRRAISQGYFNPDSEIQRYWRSKDAEGKMPSPEKIIEILENEIAQDKINLS